MTNSAWQRAIQGSLGFKSLTGGGGGGGGGAKTFSRGGGGGGGETLNKRLMSMMSVI